MSLKYTTSNFIPKVKKLVFINFAVAGDNKIEIYEENDFVHVLSRNGWSDKENDFDVSWYIPRSQDRPDPIPPKGWGFAVKKSLYLNAWNDLLNHLKSNPLINSAAAQSKFSKMKVAELKEELRKRNITPKGRKAELIKQLTDTL